MQSRHTPILVVIFFSSLFILPLIVSAQPSGGPYGPIPQTWELPVVEGTIYYVAPDGETNASGKMLEEPTTIETAIERVKTGDAVILRGGVYRTGNLILNQSITLQPYENEQPILKGTYVAPEWRKLRFNTWKTSWPRLFPTKPQSWWQRDREGERTPQHRFNNDMVFVDGKFLQSAGWEGELDENSYYIDYETGSVYIGVDPADHLVEITAFDVAILRTTGKVHGKKSDGRGPIIRGITFTQYAYRALEVKGTDPEGLSDEANHGKEVIGTTLEHCTISYCSRVAAYLRGDHLTLRHCKISDTSTEGIYLLSSADALLEKNIFTRNNIEHITGYFPAAVKIFNQCYRVTCRDNLVIDLPYSNGIWYDVGNVDGVFVNNWVQDVGLLDGPFSTNQPWPSDNGFFFEISKGVTCVGNVFVNCDHGLWILNSSNAHIYQNTFINSTACIGRTERNAVGDHFGWHPATGPDVDERVGHVFVNNLMTGDEHFERPLFYVWQPALLCGRVTDSQLKELDNNVYVCGKEKASYPLILWSPADNEECQLRFDSLEEFQKIHPEFETSGQFYANYGGPLFQSPDLGNYQVQNQFSGLEAAAPISGEVKGLLRLKTGALYVGAYPPLP